MCRKRKGGKGGWEREGKGSRQETITEARRRFLVLINGKRLEEARERYWVVEGRP